MARSLKYATLAAVLAGSNAESTAVALGKNPIRKVVTMMQKMAKKIDEEGEKEEELYKKFECYCKTTTKELNDAITKQTESPVTAEDVAKKESELKAKQDEVVQLKKDRIEDEESLKAAKVNRGNEHKEFEKVVKEETETEETATAALKALSFLQTSSTHKKINNLDKLLKALDRSSTVPAAAKPGVAAFLQGQAGAPDSSDVVVYIKDIEKDAEEKIKDENVEEDTEVKDYTGVKKSKKSEIKAVLEMMEKKMKAIGELQVEIVNMKHDMADGAEALEANKKMLVEITKDCKQKAADWDERVKARSEEQLALADTIKMLNSDDALELFKKTVGPATSLLQLSSGMKQQKAQALSVINKLRSEGMPNARHRSQLNFIALSLQGKKVDFSKVFKQIDEMIVLMKKEQVDDDKKKEYCNDEFDANADKTKDIKKKIEETASSIEIAQGQMEKLDDEVAAINEGVKALDKSVADAGENRKEEHEEYQELVSGNTAAIKLLGMAKNRLNKFYNPSMFSDTTTPNPMDPYAFAQLSQEPEKESLKVEVGEAPKTFEGGLKQKDEGNNRVMTMISTIEGDLEKEMTIAKTEEANAQKEYEESVKDAATKREADLKSVAAKLKAKSDFGSDLTDDKETKKAKEGELLAAGKVLADLKGQCDWLLKNYDLRKSARTEEMESLTTAKATLAGADFSFLELKAVNNLRGAK
eukprot:TRINITY_DN65_c0_g1_i2.p1 TRINITY_DN65_c0_g1~~TRINITY_DN65_c0_g1_i2.p1  ORF type:complete len:736 (-),score=292.40 TRINITY_DN65_c0_g1_i2:65-2167(-)